MRVLEQTPEPPTPRTLLITLTGRDRPGVTSLVFDTLARFGVEVVDIEQIVLRRRLILGCWSARRAPGRRCAPRSRTSPASST